MEDKNENLEQLEDLEKYKVDTTYDLDDKSKEKLQNNFVFNLDEYELKDESEIDNNMKKIDETNIENISNDIEVLDIEEKQNEVDKVNIDEDSNIRNEINLEEEIENTIDNVSKNDLNEESDSLKENEIEKNLEYSGINETIHDDIIINELIEETSNNSIEKNTVTERKRMPQFFIGKNYDKITKKKFSFSAFIFGGTYYIYRKMYLKGILLLILSLILSNTVPIILSNQGYLIFVPVWYVVLFIIMIIIGFRFNKSYVKFVKKKLEKIKKLHLSYDESAKKCERKGGTNIIVTIVIIIILSIIYYKFITMLFSQFLINFNNDLFGIFFNL